MKKITSDALARHIADQIIRIQTRLANVLNRKTQHWNKTSKLIALAAFMIVFGGLSIYLIIKSI
ncbi:hypothetical protein SAMN05192574_102323 [Mucilaginibacter gossypiicola]|uniref:Uncharacterized protein n=1 Tax=Mucilaginibacter gossypiicola TaxID=551995 RepID=A0A1H8DGC2_9SPHI|nr:hypothetical protein [Mucilaginibacter gossypiicola]SEN05844.1 hypothetical protein SAMN05192574_102323 [Mucilaginibacter gossypiicola]